MHKTPALSRRYLLPVILSVVLIVCFSLTYRSSLLSDEIPLSILVPGGNRNEQINLWKDKSNTLYCFLPANVEFQACTWVVNSQHKVSIDGISLKTGSSLAETDSDTIHTLNIGITSYLLRIMQSENLPTLYLDTASHAMEYLEADKNNQLPAYLNLVNTECQSEYCSELTWISGRGNSTWSADKKPWTLNLRTETSLLGMPASKKWVLLANALDDSNGLRNCLVYNMAQDLGVPYTSRVRFVDLYINHVYYGTYQLAEKIEIEKNRLDFDPISSLRPDGGYILERNYGYKLYGRDYYFITDRSDGFVVRAPSSLAPSALQSIQADVQRVEDALFSPNFEADNTSLSSLIDMASWVDRYLIDEVTKNEGAGSTSSYFYKKADNPLLFSGPVWDYDKSLGSYRHWQNPMGLAYSSLHLASTLWWKQFYSYPEAQSAILSRYENVYRPYLQKLVQTDIEQWSQYIYASDAMNRIRWASLIRSYSSEFPHWILENGITLENSAQYLKTWLQARIDFLDDVWINNQQYCTITVHYSNSQLIDYEYVRYGDCFQPDNAQSLTDMFGQPYDFSQPITKDTDLMHVPAETVSVEESYDVHAVRGRSQRLMIFAVYALLFGCFGLAMLYHGIKHMKRR